MKLKATLLAVAVLLGGAVGAQAKDVQVKEYTRKDGAVVNAHTRQVKDKADAKADTQEVKGYTKKDGTVVKGYTRKKADKAGKKS